MAEWYSWVQVPGRRWVPVSIGSNEQPVAGDVLWFWDPVTGGRHSVDAGTVGPWSSSPAKGVRYLAARIQRAPVAQEP